MTHSRRQEISETTTASPRRLEFGTACLAILIAATLGGGVAVLSASPLVAVVSALGIIAVLALVVAAMV